jgi:hypothetical protein
VDEAILVKQQDINDGARLVQELDVRGLPLTAGFWAHDASVDIWRLVLVVPRNEISSPRQAYSRVQDAISHLSLKLFLNQVTVILDDDPQIRVLQSLIASSSSNIVEIPLDYAEIAGQIVDKGYAYRLEALRYEAEILAALQRIQPKDAILRRVDGLDVGTGLESDFVINDGDQAVFIETKALTRPLDSRDVQVSADRLYRITDSYPRPESWLMISRTGYTQEATRLAAGSPSRIAPVKRLSLVEWVSPNDDPQLREALGYLLGHAQS